jgi:hypothetical protein
MVQPAGDEGRGSEVFYSPATKCCTYLPELANFLVGRILSDDDPRSAAGRATVVARIGAGAAVSPLGLHRTSVYALLYRSSPTSFGHASAMLCPHYMTDSGSCGVWRHRESTCATWFCKHERGATGRTFWHRLHDTLGAAEEALRIHCVLELGLDARALATIFPPHAPPSVTARTEGLSASEIAGQRDPALQRAIWGSWLGREHDFFERCAAIVAPLAWSDIERIGGARLALLSRLLVEAHEKLVSREVPRTVRRRHLRVVYASRESVHLVGYSHTDPLRVPKELVDALDCFDGRPTRDALDAIERRNKLRLTPGVVRKLVDFGVLAAGGDEIGRGERDS